MKQVVSPGGDYRGQSTRAKKRTRASEVGRSKGLGAHMLKESHWQAERCWNGFRKLPTPDCCAWLGGQKVKHARETALQRREPAADFAA